MGDTQKRPWYHRKDSPETSPQTEEGESNISHERLIEKELPEELPGDPMMTRDKVDDLFSK